MKGQKQTIDDEHDGLLRAKPQARVKTKSHIDPIMNTNFLP